MPHRPMACQNADLLFLDRRAREHWTRFESSNCSIQDNQLEKSGQFSNNFFEISSTVRVFPIRARKKRKIFGCEVFSLLFGSQ